MIFAGVNVVGDGNLQVGFIGRLAGGDHVVLVIYPGVDGGLDGLLGTVCRFGAVGVMVEVVVDFQVVGTQFYIIRESVIERDDAAAVVRGTVDR